MHQLRVVSVNDATEWVLPLREGQQQIQIAELKRLVLAQKQQQFAEASSPRGAQDGARKQRRRQEDEQENKSEANGDDNDDDGSGGENGGGDDSYVMFHGRILADMDFFNLNALAASDFFVFAQENAESEECENVVEADPELEPEERDDETKTDSRRRKRKRNAAVEEDGEKVQQLVAMGFGSAQVQLVLQQTDNDLARAIAILTGDESAVEMSSAISNGLVDASVRDLVRKHPQLQVLQPVLGELQALSVPQVAAADIFQALMLLKENVSSDSLAQLNSHPCATIELFRLPLQSLSPSRGALNKRPSAEPKSSVIDLVNDPFDQDESRASDDRAEDGDLQDDEAIERVRALWHITYYHCCYYLTHVSFLSVARVHGL